MRRSVLFSAERGTIVLPRVTSVLRKFLSPIAEIAQTSSVGSHFVQDHPKNKGDQNPQKPPSDEPPPDPSPTEAPSRPKLKLVENSPIPPPSIGDIPAILQLFALLKSQRELMLRWVGVKSYKSSARDQQKSSHLEKGVILDQKAD